MTNPLQLARKALELPVLRPAQMHWRHQEFLLPSAHAAYFGVFEDFTQARASLPPSREFDNPALAREYVEVRTKRVFTYDYPVMWWLERAFASGATRILDIGGSVGVHYYAYQRYIVIPENVLWQVVEVPAMVHIGQQMAQQNHAHGLQFTTNLASALNGADIWIASGSIQYFEDAHPSNLLRQLDLRPRHLLLNKLPLYDGEDFVTTQNLGEGAFSPVHVWNRNEFVRSICMRGFLLQDAWDVPDRSLLLPGHPDRNIPTFAGLYFVSDTTGSCSFSIRHAEAKPSRESRGVAEAPNDAQIPPLVEA